MKTTNLILLVFLLSVCAKTLATPVEFVWTAVDKPAPIQFDLSVFLEYSGGTIENGIFTPTGLVDSSWGIPNRLNPYFALTDTDYGPSFNIHGIIEPLSLERIDIPSKSWVFQGQTEKLSFFDTGPPTV